MDDSTKKESLTSHPRLSANARMAFPSLFSLTTSGYGAKVFNHSRPTIPADTKSTKLRVLRVFVGQNLQCGAPGGRALPARLPRLRVIINNTRFAQGTKSAKFHYPRARSRSRLENVTYPESFVLLSVHFLFSMHVLLNTRYAQGTKNTKLGALCALVFIGCGYAALRFILLKRILCTTYCCQISTLKN